MLLGLQQQPYNHNKIKERAMNISLLSTFIPLFLFQSLFSLNQFNIDDVTATHRRYYELNSNINQLLSENRNLLKVLSYLSFLNRLTSCFKFLYLRCLTNFYPIRPSLNKADLSIGPINIQL